MANCLYWSLVLLSSLYYILLIKAIPKENLLLAITGNKKHINLWEHVNKTCLLTSADCAESINMAQMRDIEGHMRPDVDPCNDFYQYACGNWARDVKYRKSRNMMKYGDQLITQRQLNIILQARHQPQKNIILQKMLHYFSICQRTVQQASGISIRGYFESLQTLGLWNTSDNWLNTLAHLGRFGYAEHYIQLHVKQRNVSHHEIHILPHNSQTCVKLNTELYNVISIYTSYNYIKLSEAFQNIDEKLKIIVSNGINDCLELDEDNECDQFVYYNLEHLQSEIPFVDWQSFLSLHLGRQIMIHEVFLVDALPTIKRLVSYIDNLEPELRFLYSLVRFLNYLQTHMKLLLPVDYSLETISFSCIKHMRKTLYVPMLYIYEWQYYEKQRAQNEQLIRKVFEQLKTTFRQKLLRNDMQLSQTSLRFLQDKLHSLRLNLGNLPTNVTQQFYIDFIKSLNVSGNFYNNHLNTLLHYSTHLRSLTRIDNPQREIWYTFNHHSPDMPDNVDSTAYYFVLSNMIVIPFAYLQSPFYDGQFIPALLYGDLANTLGHEMTHAFDNYFLLYDQFGNMVEKYREIESNVEYRKRLSKLEPGALFLSERIADISGTRLAIETFLKDKEFLRKNGELYFLQFAQFFCGDESNHTQILLDDDMHDFSSLRLNYTLSHIAEFSEIFNCSPNSPMNPNERYIMW